MRAAMMAEQLKAVGFADVTMLRSTPPASDPVGPSGHVCGVMLLTIVAA